MNKTSKTNCLTPEQIKALNNIIDTEHDGVTRFYQRLAEITVAYSRMYLLLDSMGGDPDLTGSPDDLYMLSSLMEIFKPQ